MYHKNNLQKGFTLPEMLLATMFLAIIVAAVVAFSTFYFQSFSFSFEETQSIQVARSSMTMILREIREIRDGADGSWPIDTADDMELIYYSDVTNDGFSDKVKYFVDGTDLRRSITEPSLDPIEYLPENEKFSTIATDIDTLTGPIFTYYNGNWPEDIVNNPLPVDQRKLNTRYIHLRIIINIADDYGSKPYDLSSGVQLRGLKDNL
ncbi:type II secretion system protein J [Patescibacteria group bacterium]